MRHSEASQGLRGHPDKATGSLRAHGTQQLGLARGGFKKKGSFFPQSGGFRRKRGRRWHRMSPTASTSPGEHTSNALHRPKSGRGSHGRGQPQPQLLQPAPGTPVGVPAPRLRCRLPADAARGVPKLGGLGPGRKCHLSPHPSVRTGAKEGTGALKKKKKIPLQRCSHRMCVREPRVALQGCGECPCPLWAGGQPGKGHQRGTGSVPPALPVSPQPLSGQG